MLFEFHPYCCCLNRHNYALNRHNYAHNLSCHYVHTRALKEENAAGFTYLEEGGFSGSVTGISHSRIPFDQLMEITISKSCKDVGGLPQNTEPWCNTKVG